MVGLQNLFLVERFLGIWRKLHFMGVRICLQLNGVM